MITKSQNDMQVAGELFMKLYDKYSKMESKKFLYKEIKEITIIEINTILVVGRGEKLIKMSEIANILGVTYGTPTVTIDRLIKKGYVERYRDENDRRNVLIKLSPKGDEVFRLILLLKSKVIERIFCILTPEQSKVLIEIFSTLNNNFEDVFSKPL